MEEKKSNQELTLEELFDIEQLQQLQDTFFEMTSLSMGISTASGIPFTMHRTTHEFCLKYTRSSELGRKRCMECDVQGQRVAAMKGKPVIYKCHAGLMDFAAPIFVKGEMVGSFLGGQVTETPLKEEDVRAYAKELGVDPDVYWSAAQKIPRMSRAELNKLANFLSTLANMMSNLAYQKFYLQETSTEIEREAHMKSDFLANMSHEIRTPMNAVIGMAEMALREELPPAAKEYVAQIKTAGNSLLAIINDILDFSKIESGKMNINMVPYQPLSIVNDISNIIMTRIGDKNVELLIDFDPDIPYELMGDDIRIKQVIMNLANNAVKFTKEGYVKLRFSCEKMTEHEVRLRVAVKDSGIGIKEEDKDKLFKSFSQVDSKRNRNNEGTGLGLAISKQLIGLMKGHIWMESQYGKGSEFGFDIPQLLLHDKGCSVKIENSHNITAGILSDNPFIQSSMKYDIERYGAKCMMFTLLDELQQLVEQGAEFLFVDEPMFSSSVRRFVEEHPKITCVLMVGFDNTDKYDISNLLVIRKPLFALNIGNIFNHEQIYHGIEEQEVNHFDFIAPDAHVLIVDDNEVNLSVAKGLIEPLQMHVDTALNGKIAIDMIECKQYDLIFMDHMMPQLDGVETTHIIRRFHEEYNNVPIIALTANAVEEMRSMFLTEGMNDFIAKPIEIGVITSKIKHWLPAEKIQECAESDGHSRAQQEEGAHSLKTLSKIEGLDISLALKFLGSEKLLWQVIRDYYHVIKKKAGLIWKYYEKKDWHNYSIEVHALKSASKQIGAVQLSSLAEELEKASKEGKEDIIMLHTGELLEQYLGYEKKLKPLVGDEDAKPKADAVTEASTDVLRQLFDEMCSAIDELDMDGMEHVVNELSKYAFSADQKVLYERLREASEMMDVDNCMTLIADWKKLLA